LVGFEAKLPIIPYVSRVVKLIFLVIILLVTTTVYFYLGSVVGYFLWKISPIEHIYYMNTEEHVESRLVGEDPQVIADVRNLVSAGVPVDYVFYTFNFRNELRDLVDIAGELRFAQGYGATDALISFAKYLKERDEAQSYNLNDVTMEKVAPEEIDSKVKYVLERLNSIDPGTEEIHNKISFIKFGDKQEEGYKDLGVELVDKYLDLGIPAPVLALEIITKVSELIKESRD